MIAKLKKMLAAAEPPGLRDVLLATGLGLVAYGLYQVYPPAAAAVPGAVLVAVAIFGVCNRSPR